MLAEQTTLKDEFVVVTFLPSIREDPLLLLTFSPQEMAIAEFYHAVFMHFNEERRREKRKIITGLKCLQK